MKNTKRVWYPTINEVIKINKLMVDKFRATKAEKHEVLSRQQIVNSIKQTKEFPGSIEDKASILVRTMSYHPFGSANRRTAYYLMNKFLWKNKNYGILKKKKKGKEFMKKIRRGEYSHHDVVNEIKYKK